MEFKQDFISPHSLLKNTVNWTLQGGETTRNTLTYILHICFYIHNAFHCSSLTYAPDALHTCSISRLRELVRTQ